MKHWKNVFGQILQNKKAMIFALVAFTIVHKIVVILVPSLTQKLVDVAVYPSPTQQSQFVTLVWQNVIVGVLALLLLCLRYYLKYQLEIYTECKLKEDIVLSIQKKREMDLRARPLGFVLQLIARDVEKSLGLIVWDAMVFVLNLIYAIVVFSILFRYHVGLALMVCVLLPLFTILSKIMLPKIEKVNEALNESRDDLSERTEELLSGSEHSKLEIPKASIEKLVGQILTKYKALALCNAKLDIAYDFGMVNGIMNLANLLLYVWGGYAILKGEMTVGQLTGFAIYFSTLWGVGEGMLDFFKSYKVKMLSLQRIEEFQNIPNEPENEDGIANFSFESLQLKGIDFAYEGKSIFENLSFQLHKGERVLLKGGNGSGKSTLAKIIVHMLYPQSGQVLLNGQPLQAYKLSALREKIKLVLPEPFFLKGSLDESSQESHLAGDRLNKLELDGPLASKGKNLSSGQRKILQLARQLSTKAELFILDEPLNFIDQEAKQKVLDYIAEAFVDKSLIIISHQEEVFTRIVDKTWEIVDKGLVEN